MAKEYSYTSPNYPGDGIEFGIVDPDGVAICDVYSEEEAIAVIQHLNRGG